MCVAVLGAALSIAGSIAEYGAANDAANKQNQYYLENAKEAQRAARETYVHQNLRVSQERGASSQEMFEAQLKGIKARATARASAGEAGVAGVSVDSLLQDLYGQSGRQMVALETQYEMNRNSVRAQMDETEAKARARIQSVQRADSPSFAPFLIKGMTGALGAFKSSSLAVA